jgi:hypothetical protein
LTETWVLEWVGKKINKEALVWNILHCNSSTFNAFSLMDLPLSPVGDGTLGVTPFPARIKFSWPYICPKRKI